jgi:hypothetical protein
MANAGATLTGNALTFVQGSLNAGGSMRGTVTLPSVEARGAASQNPVGQGAVVLPSLSAKGYGGGNASISLLHVVASGSATVQEVARAALVLPSLQARGTALAGGMAEAALLLRSVVASGWGGATGRASLPSVAATGHAYVEEHAFAAIQLRALSAAGTGFTWSEVARGAIVLPALVAGDNGRGVIILPHMLAGGYATNNIAASTQAWVYNVKHGAVTQFTNFPFRVFVRWRNRYYGVGLQGGLYLLGDGTDAGDPIAWNFETGLDDMDNPAQKGVMGVYIDGLIAKGAELTLVTDTRARYTYELRTPVNSEDYRPYRVSTGRGIRTRSVGIAMSSTIGGDVTINQIAPEFVISKRNA